MEVCVQKSADTACESTTTEKPTAFCCICVENRAKYVCPRCSIKTCSLKCCNEHKLKTDCNGKRNVAAYISRKDYDHLNFLSDYRLLESVDRDNEFREKQLTELRVTAQNRHRDQLKLSAAARKLGVDFRSSGSLLARAKLNKSRLLEAPPPSSSSASSPKVLNFLPSIFWSIEFCLLPPSSQPNCSLRSDIAWKSETLRPIRIFVHDCPNDIQLARIWRERVLALPSTEQEALTTNAIKPAAGVVTSWILALLASEKPGYFYIQCELITCEGDKQKRFPKHEVFPESQLIDILKYNQFVVHEFPTIWVSLNEISTFIE